MILTQMNNSKSNKSVIGFRCGICAFLIYWVCLLLVVLFTTEVISESMIGQILYFSGLALIFVSLILGCIAIIYSALKINAPDIIDKYFAKLGLSYGFFTALIWSFLGISFVMYGFTQFASSTVTLEEKILFFAILAILSLTPLSLHVWFKVKLKGMRRNFA